MTKKTKTEKIHKYDMAMVALKLACQRMRKCEFCNSKHLSINDLGTEFLQDASNIILFEQIGAKNGGSGDER